MADRNFDERISRLETIVETIATGLHEIRDEIKQKAKIEWAPIAIGVTIFFTVSGSVATIYNTRISTLNTAVEHIASRVADTEKNSVENRLRLSNNSEKTIRNEEDIRRLDDRVRMLEQRR